MLDPAHDPLRNSECDAVLQPPQAGFNASSSGIVHPWEKRKATGGGAKDAFRSVFLMRALSADRGRRARMVQMSTHLADRRHERAIGGHRARLRVTHGRAGAGASC